MPRPLVTLLLAVAITLGLSACTTPSAQSVAVSAVQVASAADALLALDEAVDETVALAHQPNPAMSDDVREGGARLLHRLVALRDAVKADAEIAAGDSCESDRPCRVRAWLTSGANLTLRLDQGRALYADAKAFFGPRRSTMPPEHAAMLRELDALARRIDAGARAVGDATTATTGVSADQVIQGLQLAAQIARVVAIAL